MVIHSAINPGMIARPDARWNTPLMKSNLIAAAEIDRLDTWAKYSAPMCGSCISSCCTLPVEVKVKDLIRIGLVDEFELGDPPKNIAKRLQKEGIVERFNSKSEIFTLQRMSNLKALHPGQGKAELDLFLRRFESEVDEVPDPYYEGEQGFERVLDLIERACDLLVIELKGRL